MANVKVSTINTSEGYQQPVDPNTTGALANGFYPQNSTSNDAAVGLERDSSGGLVLKANSQTALGVTSDGAVLTIPAANVELTNGQLGLSLSGIKYNDLTIQTTSAGTIGRVITPFTTNSTSYVTVTAASVALAANTPYLFQARIIWQSTSTAAGPGFSISAPSSPSVLDYTVTYQTFANATAGSMVARHDTAVDAMAALTTTTAANTPYVAFIEGVIATTNAGTLAVRLCSSSALAVMAARPGTFLNVRVGST